MLVACRPDISSGMVGLSARSLQPYMSESLCFQWALVHVQETSLGMPYLPCKSPLTPLYQRGE
jgi:hypothetical protein